MINDDQLFMLMGLWFHWVAPVLVLAMIVCFTVAGAAKIIPPKDQNQKKEDKGS